MTTSTRHAPLLLHNTMRTTEVHVGDFRPDVLVPRLIGFVRET